LESVEKVAENWGGKFKIRYEKNYRKPIKSFKGKKIHLTFYGLPLHQKVEEIRKDLKKSNLMIIIGAEKVPRDVYQAADYNISISNQPHSEVAALAITLHEIMEGKELKEEFQNKRFAKAKRKIIPCERGKKFA